MGVVGLREFADVGLCGCVVGLCLWKVGAENHLCGGVFCVVVCLVLKVCESGVVCCGVVRGFC